MLFSVAAAVLIYLLRFNRKPVSRDQDSVFQFGKQAYPFRIVHEKVFYSLIYIINVVELKTPYSSVSHDLPEHRV
jgi:hypothetical protein